MQILVLNECTIPTHFSCGLVILKICESRSMTEFSHNVVIGMACGDVFLFCSVSERSVNQ